MPAWAPRGPPRGRRLHPALGQREQRRHREHLELGRLAQSSGGAATRPRTRRPPPRTRPRVDGHAVDEDPLAVAGDVRREVGPGAQAVGAQDRGSRSASSRTCRWCRRRGRRESGPAAGPARRAAPRRAPGPGACRNGQADEIVLPVAPARRCTRAGSRRRSPPAG